MNHLHSICSSGNLEELERIVKECRCVSYFLENEFNLEIYNAHGMNPLHCASYFGHLPVVSFLVESNLVDINSLSKSPHNTFASALHYAIVGNHKETVFYLLERGADLFIRDYRGHTALSLARLHQHKKITAILQEAIKERNKKYLESNRITPVNSMNFVPSAHNMHQHLSTVRSWNEFKLEFGSGIDLQFMKKSLSLDE